MMYDFYDYKAGFEAGKEGKEFDCPYERKNEIMQWCSGWKDGRSIYERCSVIGERISKVNDSTHKQAIVLRKDLKMPPGKAIAQGCHASLAAVWSVDYDDPRVVPWREGRFTKTALRADSEKELLELYDAAKAAGVIAYLIEDSGFTVFNGVKTVTGVGIGPDTIEKMNEVCGHLKLY